MSRVDPLAEVVRLAERQLDAARRVDAPGLQKATEARKKAQERLDVAGLRRLPVKELVVVRQLLLRLQALDARILTCGQTVLEVISVMLPDGAPPSYSRRGELRSA